MRVSLLLLPIFFCLSLHARSPFAPVGAQWTYTQHHVSGPDTNLFVIQCTRDTVIQGRTCSKLAYIEGMNDCMPFLPALTRQGDSVLAYQPYYDAFTTLYVFGQAPGFSWETLIEYPFGTDTITWTVTDTGHVDIDWMELRSQHVTATASGYYNTVPLTSGTIIDLLGDLQYLFPWIYGACDSENNFPLRCYEEGTLPAPGPPPSISWLNPQYPQCALSTGVQELNAYQGFSISPSSVQAGQAFTITLPPGAGNAHLRILDSSGRIVIDREVHGSEVCSIPQAGVYLVQARGGGSAIATQRLVVN